MSGDAALQLRALVVEDDLDSCDALRRLLVRQGHQVRCAATAADACRALLEHAAPDVILLDLMLPDGNGSAVLLRARELCPRARIAVMTAAGANSLTVEMAAALRPDAMFLKPMRFADILAWLEQPPETGG
jgi:DNA-binding response OmpR family regulator